MNINIQKLPISVAALSNCDVYFINLESSGYTAIWGFVVLNIHYQFFIDATRNFIYTGQVNYRDPNAVVVVAGMPSAR